MNDPKLEEDIPKVYFSKHESLLIEVMNVGQLMDKLNHSKDHDPFAIYKIEFYLILVLTKHSYTHFVDFSSYTLTAGSALFVAKNQVHHFNKGLREAEGFCIVFNSVFVDKSYFLANTLKLNRLFNYHIEAPVVHQQEMGEDSFIDIAREIFDEYGFPNHFAKSEILSTLLQVLLLKAERAKEFQSIQGVKPHWLVTFSTFKDMLEKEYANTRKSNDI